MEQNKQEWYDKIIENKLPNIINLISGGGKNAQLSLDKLTESFSKRMMNADYDDTDLMQKLFSKGDSSTASKILTGGN